jgi:hypothetical protein
MLGIKGRSGFRKTLTPEFFLKIVTLTNALINSAEFKSRSRTKEHYFTRKRKMNFEELMLYILNSYEPNGEVLCHVNKAMVGTEIFFQPHRYN